MPSLASNCPTNYSSNFCTQNKWLWFHHKKKSNRWDYPTNTTGLSGFAECQGHSAKANLHSAKALPSAAFGKGHSAKNGPAKVSLLSVFCRALGKAFAECRHSAKLNPKKTRKNGNFYQKKWKQNFYQWRPPPTSTHLSQTFFAWISWLRGRHDSNPRPPAVHVPPLPLHHTLTYVCIPF